MNEGNKWYQGPNPDVIRHWKKLNEEQDMNEMRLFLYLKTGDPNWIVEKDVPKILLKLVDVLEINMADKESFAQKFRKEYMDGMVNMDLTGERKMKDVKLDLSDDLILIYKAGGVYEKDNYTLLGKRTDALGNKYYEEVDKKFSAFDTLAAHLVKVHIEDYVTGQAEEFNHEE